MGYLGINMSGSSIPVYSTNIENNTKIGTLLHKERFAVTSSGPLAILIKFVNSSGSWVEGRLSPDAAISDWCKYLFIPGAIAARVFRTDRTIDMYDSGQNPINATTYGMFIDCKIRYDSGNTPIYGNWN